MNQSACRVVVVLVTVGIAIAVVVNGQTAGEALPRTASLDAASSGPAFAGRSVVTGKNLTQSSAIEPVKPAGGTVSAAGAAVRFTEISHEAGVDFLHVNGASADKHLVETIGSGGLFFDYDNDGWIDMFLVDGGSLADPAVAQRARHRLFRNRGDGTFDDSTARSGIGHRGYGMGACAGDYDNDGWVDLFVTSYGSNTLYRNAGTRRFTDVTTAARAGSSSWSTSCAFADLDRDGDLDLFVTNYVAVDPKHSPFCGNASSKTRFYCHPLNFEPLANIVLRNNGNGTFSDVSAASGIGAYRGNGLGVVIGDFDEDGWPEVFVANDSVPNFLFHRTGAWRYADVALRAGVAVASDGRARAGMGTDAGDYDGDGQVDLVVTNLDSEMHSLYRGLGNQLFAYATPDSGIGPATLPFVGFGVVFFDFDNDTQLDLAIANGHIMDNAPLYRAGATYAQRNQLFRNVSRGRLAEVGRSAGAGFAIEKVSRGLGAGDIDNDGDLDLLVTNNGQAADLLRNEGVSGNALLARTIGKQSNRDGVGAQLRLTIGTQTQKREVKAGSSYLGQNDQRQHFGLGAATRVDRLEVRWPSGTIDVLQNIEANQIITVREGDGIISARRFAP